MKTADRDPTADDLVSLFAFCLSESTLLSVKERQDFLEQSLSAIKRTITQTDPEVLAEVLLPSVPALDAACEHCLPSNGASPVTRFLIHPGSGGFYRGS